MPTSTSALVPEPGEGQRSGQGTVVVIDGPPEAPRIAPFERLAVPAALSGGEGTHRGANRAGAFAFIRGAARPCRIPRVPAPLPRPATRRAYTRELERFVLRAAFAWLVDVRYLAGNPWAAVTDPATVTREIAVQVERALPAALWATVRSALDSHCRAADVNHDADHTADPSGEEAVSGASPARRSCCWGTPACAAPKPRPAAAKPAAVTVFDRGRAGLGANEGSEALIHRLREVRQRTAG